MSEQELLNELKIIGWEEIDRTHRIAIFSFAYGIKYCLIDFSTDDGMVYAYDKYYCPEYLTSKEAKIFGDLCKVLIVKRKVKGVES